MKKTNPFLLVNFLFIVGFTYWVSAETNQINYEASPTGSSMIIVNANDYSVSADTIKEPCPQQPFVQLVPEGVEYSESNTYLTCIWDTITLNPGPDYTYVWDNRSTEQTYRFYSTGIGYDKQTHWVIAEDIETGCFDTAWITVIFGFKECVTGFPEEEDKRFGNIYPNPGNGLFNLPVKNDPGDVQLEVLDITGQLKYVTNFVAESGESTQPIDLSRLSNGLYIIRIVGEDFIHMEKVIKQ